MLKFAVLGSNPQGLEDTAAALIKNGCQAQLDLLIETVAVPEGGKPALVVDGKLYALGELASKFLAQRKKAGLPYIDPYTGEVIPGTRD